MVKVKPVVSEWKIGKPQDNFVFFCALSLFMSVALIAIFNTTKNNVSNIHLYCAILSVFAYILLLLVHYMIRWVAGCVIVFVVFLVHAFYLYKVLVDMNYI